MLLTLGAVLLAGMALWCVVHKRGRFMCSHDFSMLARCVSRVLLLDFGLLLKDVSVEQLAEQGVTIEELILSYLEVDSRDPKPFQDS